jgi:short-chain fatty acids transporter
MPASGNVTSEISEGRIARLGLALANWSEKWFPDPLVFAFLGVVAVYLIGIFAGESPVQLGLEAGKNFWTLVPFTMQMVMIIIGGYVVASSSVIRRAISWLAGRPKTPRGAVALVAFVASTSSLISWGLSLIISAFLVREMAGRVKGMDYRAAGAAAYLGVCSVWALGLSSSAAMLMATKSSMPPALFAISGLIPLTQTLFLWQSMVTAVIVIATAVSVAYFSAPAAEHARTAESYGLRFDPPSTARERHTKPGEWLEFSPVLNILVGVLLLAYLVNVFRTSPQGALAALDLNIYNLLFLAAGLLLHWRPRNFVRAVAESIPATGGVLIQFPFYAMIFGMIVGTGLSAKLAHLFTSASTHDTFALLAAGYSALLGLFIPSGGSKWVVEAPYVLEAAIAHQVHMGWVVQIYNAAEALPNLINPFWMLPLLGILRIKARDLVGYSTLYLIVQLPVVFFLCWFFARSMPFIAPHP